VPVTQGQKSDKEKFAGALYTTTVEVSNLCENQCTWCPFLAVACGKLCGVRRSLLYTTTVEVSMPHKHHWLPITSVFSVTSAHPALTRSNHLACC
jgi:hypothetical protein